jgi:metal-responsive CopG/Arc/MetJ family transcriptional regulator
VYNPGVDRTQIYLGNEEIELLDAAAERTGASRSELIRRAIRAQYPPRAKRGRTPEERLANIMTAAGLWKDRPFTTEEYLDAIRHGKKLPGE